MKSARGRLPIRRRPGEGPTKAGGRLLSTRISWFVAAIVVLAIVLMALIGVVVMRSWMIRETDDALHQEARRVERIFAGGGSVGRLLDTASNGGGPDRRTGAESSAGEGFGDSSGFGGPGSEGRLRVVARGSQARGLFIRGPRVVELGPREIGDLLASSADGPPRTVSVGAIGRVRVISRTNGTDRVVVGQSLDEIEATARRILLIDALVGLAVVLVSAFVGRLWVSRELRPLDAVAVLARGLGRRNLSSDEVGPFERVPEEIERSGTEVGDVATALNAMIDNVESALRARAESEAKLRRFVADASHELRTPLASIQGYAQLLQRDSIESELALARISSESKRMSGLVEDLLLLARLDAGRELECAPVDLVPLAIDALSDAHAAGPDHEWVLEVPGGEGDEAFEDVRVLGDEAALRQVLANLLTNARVHTPAGTRVVLAVGALPVAEGDARVRESGARSWRQGAGPAGSVRIRVADDGPGIPEELRSTVFDRFVRGDASRTRAGSGSSGLGLSIVASIGRALSGRVEMTTSQEGTTFEVVLPRCAPTQ